MAGFISAENFITNLTTPKIASALKKGNGYGMKRRGSMRNYVIVPYPESKKWENHPDSILIVDPEVAGPSAYMVPRNLLEDEKRERIITPFPFEE